MTYCRNCKQPSLYSASWDYDRVEPIDPCRCLCLHSCFYANDCVKTPEHDALLGKALKPFEKQIDIAISDLQNHVKQLKENDAVPL